ncbi:SH3 domain-containing protein [Duganella sp. FT80W]|uniref:SH3 domain-containing protein n=1 Tax=Duganella guangzhouensis TaxID=2666084 RepID=A0A6I2KUP1_9BURK|nr:SH3 domain-containing protein [Duganella guangzhouensis]MRW88787.1 SH3 domain-containing protein [Duganella guangzhouensis]
MDAAKLYAAGAFAAGLVVTLFLAAYLTPRGWWRRPNARALFIMIAGAWGFGSLILYASHAPVFSAHAATSAGGPVTVAAALPTAADATADTLAGPTSGQPFRVHRTLNLRAAPGVHAARVALVPAGAIVTPTGERHGDWWQIQSSADGHTTTGWVSSLWLRRSGE